MHDHHASSHHDSSAPTAPTGMDVPVGLIATIGIAGTFAVIAIILATEAWYYHETNVELETKSLGVANVAIQDLRASQLAKISTYRWVDQSKGIAAIPIERAMELTIQDHRKN